MDGSRLLAQLLFVRPLTRAVVVCALCVACTGVSLGPNDGAGVEITAAQRRAGIALSEAPKVLLAGDNPQITAAPEVYIIAPLGSEKAERVEAYLRAWAEHPVFAAQLGEYGVTGMDVVGVLPTTYAWPSFSFDGESFVSGVTVSNVEAAIAEALAAAPQVSITQNTVFVVVVPDGISVSLTGEMAYDACAQGVLSWHAATRFASPDVSVPYVALGACGGQAGFSEDDTMGMALSHAVINALTNPRGQGYHGITGEASAWQALPGTQEAASLCAAAMAKSKHVVMRVDDVPYVIHRSWSNKQSAKGAPPCLPAQDDDYTAALPQDTVLVPVSLASSATGVDLPGVTLAAGQAATVDVRVVGASVDANDIFVTAEALDTSALQVSVAPTSVKPHGTTELTLALSEQASDARYLVRLTTGRHGAAFSQYLIVKRTP